MGRRKHFKIDQLEPDVRETVDEMIKDGVYYCDIVEYIKSQGVTISKSSVGRYAQNLMNMLDTLRICQENFRAIMEETERYPNLDMTDGILRLISNQLLTAINNIPEEQLESLDFETIVKNAVALTRATAYKKNIDIKSKDILEAGADQFRTMLSDAMAAEEPELYKKVRKFIEKKQKELN